MKNVKSVLLIYIKVRINRQIILYYHYSPPKVFLVNNHNPCRGLISQWNFHLVTLEKAAIRKLNNFIPFFRSTVMEETNSSKRHRMRY